MKKKFFAVSVFAVIASLAFAQYGPPPPRSRPSRPPSPRHGGAAMDLAAYLSISFAAPIQWYQSYGDREIDARTVSIGTGVDLTSFFARRVGFHFSADIYFPQRMDGTESAQGVKIPISYKLQETWQIDCGISAFLGPSFALLRTPRLLFALAPGFHYYMLFAEQGRDSVFQYALGIGANAELMFNVSRNVFLRAAVDATWDFWGSEEYIAGIWVKEYSSIDRAINVTPSIGIGVKL